MELGLRSLIDERLGEHVEEIRAFVESRGTRVGPSTLEEVRAARARQRFDTTAPGLPVVEELAEADGRQVPVRILAPETDTPRGVYLDIHGGGFYMGHAASGDARNRVLADALGVAVVSVDYRLAPEHPWPAAPDDCETAARWLLDEAKSRFGTERLTIGGVSAGATLAMTTLLRLRGSGGDHPFLGAVLQFGTYDLSGQSPAGRLIIDEFFIEAYVGHVGDRTHPDISPLYADLRGLPPALLVVGSKDVLLDDNLAMAARLSAAGDTADMRVYPESPHGFTLHPTSMAAAAWHDIQAWLDDRF